MAGFLTFDLTARQVIVAVALYLSTTLVCHIFIKSVVMLWLKGNHYPRISYIAPRPLDMLISGSLPLYIWIKIPWFKFRCGRVQKGKAFAETHSWWTKRRINSLLLTPLCVCQKDRRTLAVVALKLCTTLFRLLELDRGWVHSPEDKKVIELGMSLLKHTKAAKQSAATLYLLSLTHTHTHIRREMYLLSKKDICCCSK